MKINILINVLFIFILFLIQKSIAEMLNIQHYNNQLVQNNNFPVIDDLFNMKSYGENETYYGFIYDDVFIKIHELKSEFNIIKKERNDKYLFYENIYYMIITEKNENIHILKSLVENVHKIIKTYNNDVTGFLGKLEDIKVICLFKENNKK